MQPRSARRPPGNVREEVVNTLLAQILRGQGLSAMAERRSRGSAPDVRVELASGDSMLLECKWESSASELETQLDARLRDFPDAVGVVGVLYPDWLRTDPDTQFALECAADLQWWLHGSYGERVPERPLRMGSVAQFADHLRLIPLELEGVDRVAAAAAAIGYALEQGAMRMAKHARIAFRIAHLIGESDLEKDRAAALRIACLVLFNAMAFHDRLARATDGLSTIDEALESGPQGLRSVWREIRETIDYVPVFEIAEAILEILEDSAAEIPRKGLVPLANAVLETRSLEGHDLSGRLFHTLLTSAKYTGAYYTSVPAAALLAQLVFHDWPPRIDWRDHEFPGSLDVADLACGTGTLLMAVAAEAERRHLAAGGRHAPELHKAMVEKALHGYDVQLSAVHFAATSLAMLNPDIQFDRMNLNVMPLGVDGATISLGSLDFLGSDEVPVQLALSPDPPSANPFTKAVGRIQGSRANSAADGATATLPSLDLAIMNPPFTRSVVSNLLFGSLPQSERRQMQDELARRLREIRASATAGLGAPFVVAAARKLRPGEGRLALVLPLTVCTGPSWEQTRALIEQDFTLDMVVTSHDPLRWNFSDSTDLSEVLLIATRRAQGDDTGEHRTTFINLWRNPDGIVDAQRLAHAVTSTRPANLEDSGTALLQVDGRHVGEVVSLPEDKVVGTQWLGVQFARVDLLRVAQGLLDNSEVRIPGSTLTAKIGMCQFDAIGRIGPDARRLDDGFDRTSSVTAYPLVDGHDTDVRKSLTCPGDGFLSPLVKPRGGQRPGYGDHLWQQSSRFLVGARVRLNTVRVVAMRADTDVLGRMWWPVRIEDAKVEKALTLWMNSSLGLTTLLAVRNTTQGAWVQIKKADLEKLPVLDTRQLQQSQLQALSELFDSLADAEFDRLPNMAHCPTRKALDDGLSRILGLPDLEVLRRLLASEPVVSNQRL